MAAHNLTVPARPDFPQVFTDALAQRVAESIDHIVDRILAKPVLGTCCYETEDWACNQSATVHDLASEQEFCARHFRVVSRG